MTMSPYKSYQEPRPSKVVLVCKRGCDILIGAAGCLMLLLLYPVIALLIKLESRGPAIYRQVRIGLNRRTSLLDPENALAPQRGTNMGGVPFTIYKFRSMSANAEKDGPQLASKNGDVRVTHVGKWLRKLHIDELPQFWNVLKGDMSFIGPRPERPFFTAQYAELIEHYSDRTMFTRPGITGLAQIILGYDDSTDSVIRKSYFDLSYCASLSSVSSWLRMEAWFFFHTFFYLAGRVPDEKKFNENPKLKKAVSVLNSRPGGDDVRVRTGTTGIFRFNCFNNDVLLNAESPEEIYRKLDMLGEFGQKNICITVNPKPDFGLEDMSFLVNLLRKIKHVDGSLTIRSETGKIRKILRETHMDKIIRFETVQRTITNFLTVDVECWFHAFNLKSQIMKCDWRHQTTRLVQNMDKILDLLDKHQASATFFILGWVADRFPEVVQMIDNAGHDIGTHGYYHNLITEMTQEEFEEDLEKSLNAIGKYARKPVVGHRASNFTVVKPTLWALKALPKYGIKYDSSIFPIGRKRYGIPDYPQRTPHKILIDGETEILEFPMSTISLRKKRFPIAGGGYLRFYPYRVTDRYIEQMNRAGFPAMIYFHPWELDTLQPRLNVPAVKKFMHYVNLDTTFWKLSHLLERFKFSSIGSSLESPRIKKFLGENVIMGNVENPKAFLEGSKTAAA